MTRYLIDTHALIWWWLEATLLSKSVRQTLASASSEVSVSAVSAYEIAQKVRLGKLPKMIESLDRFDELLAADGFQHLAVERYHAARAGLLVGAYRDPFDRLIAAQALTEGMTVISRDPAFAAFGCEVHW